MQVQVILYILLESVRLTIQIACLPIFISLPLRNNRGLYFPQTFLRLRSITNGPSIGPNRASGVEVLSKLRIRPSSQVVEKSLTKPIRPDAKQRRCALATSLIGSWSKRFTSSRWVVNARPVKLFREAIRIVNSGMQMVSEGQRKIRSRQSVFRNWRRKRPCRLIDLVPSPA